MTARTREALTNRARSSKPWFDQDMIDLIDTMFSLDVDSRKNTSETIKSYVSKNVTNLIQNASTTFDIKGEGFLTQRSGEWVFDNSEYLTRDVADLIYAEKDHIHDDRYYRKREVDDLVRFPSLSGDVSNSIGSVDISVIGIQGIPVPSPSANKYLYFDGSAFSWQTPTVSGTVALDDLTDVVIASVSAGQFLRYNSSTSNWENYTLPPYITGNQTITLTGDSSGSGTTSIATTVTKINGTSLAGLATGILKNTTGTGVPSIAVAADFPILNQNTTGSAATLTTGRTIGITGDVTYTSPSFNGSTNVTAAATVTRINGTALSGLATGLLKNTTGTGVPSIAVAGTDYVSPSGLTTALGAYLPLAGGTMAASAAVIFPGPYGGAVLRDLTTSGPSNGYFAIYGSGVTPSGLNYGLAVRYDGTSAFLNGTTSSNLAVGSVPVLQATTGNVTISGTASITGHLSGVSATFGRAGLSSWGPSPSNFAWFGDLGQNNNSLGNSGFLQNTTNGSVYVCSPSTGAAYIQHNGQNRITADSNGIAVLGRITVNSYIYSSLNSTTVANYVGNTPSPSYWGIAGSTDSSNLIRFVACDSAGVISGWNNIAAYNANFLGLAGLTDRLVTAVASTGLLRRAISSDISSVLSFPAGEVVYGNGTAGVTSSANMTFDGSHASITGKVKFKTSTGDSYPSSIQKTYGLGFNVNEYRANGTNASHNFYVMQNDLATESRRLFIGVSGGYLDNIWGADAFTASSLSASAKFSLVSNTYTATSSTTSSYAFDVLDITISTPVCYLTAGTSTNYRKYRLTSTGLTDGQIVVFNFGPQGSVNPPYLRGAAAIYAKDGSVLSDGTSTNVQRFGTLSVMYNAASGNWYEL